MTDDATGRLITRFVAGVRGLLPVTAVWAHGSLAGGDYQAGRSDLDLIAVLGRPCTAEEQGQLGGLHEKLAAGEPLAAKLHCSYLVPGELDDPARHHLTWAHEELKHRPVTPVTRRELHAFGSVLYGPPPAGPLPPVTDAELADFVRADLRDFWRPSLAHPEWYLQDIWVDLGLLTLARASVTLRDGSLITKGRALDVLAAMGAPAEVVADIRRRRYDPPRPVPDGWPERRAGLALDFLRPAVDAVLAARR